MASSKAANGKSRIGKSDMTPNTLNNKAIELLDGDSTSVAEEVLQQSLELCPHHPEATYNRGLIFWRSGRITDEEFIAQLEEARPHTSQGGMIDYLLGLVHIERGDRTAALEANRAAKLNGDDRLRRLATDSVSTVESDQGRWGRCVSREYAANSDVLAVSSDGRWMVSGNPYPEVLEPDVEHLFEDRSNENKGFPYLVLWDVEQGTQVRQFDGSKEVRGKLDVDQVDSGEWISHSQLIFEPIAERMFLGCAVKACFDATGRHLVSGHADGLLRLWDVVTGRCIRVFRQQQPGGVSCLAFSPDGRWVVSGGTGTTACRTWEYADPWVWLWEIESGQCARRFEGHEGHVSSVAFSPDGRRVLSTSSSIWGQGGSAGSTARVWDVTSGGCLETIDQIASPTKLVGFNSDGSIHSIFGGNETHIGGYESGGPLQTIGFNTGNRVLSRAVVSRDVRYVLSTEFSDGAARLWEIPSGRCLSTLRFERFKSLDVAFPTDGSTALLYGGSRMHRLELPDSRRSPWVLAPSRSADVESADEEQFSAK